MADSTIEQFLIQTLKTSSDVFYDFTVFKGRIYVCGGDTNATVWEFDKDSTGAPWTQIKDLTGNAIATAITTFGNKIYVAVRNDADNLALVYSWDGNDAFDFIEVEDGSNLGDVTVNTLFTSQLFGTMYAGDSGGVITRTTDGTTWTSTNVNNLSTVIDINENVNLGILVANGTAAGVGLTESTTSAAGSFSALLTGGGSSASHDANVEWHGYTFIAHEDDSGNANVTRYDGSASTAIFTTELGTGTLRDILPYNGWLYIADDNGVIWRLDGINAGSLVQVDTTSGDAVRLEIYNDWLFWINQGVVSASIISNRNFGALSLSNTNTIALNPFDK